MLIFYIRSSSYNDYALCPHRYYLTYNLNFKKPSNKAAEMGSIYHKAMELLARKKLCYQTGQDTFIETDTGATIVAAEVDKYYAMYFALALFKQKRNHVYDDNDEKIIEKYIEDTLTYRDGYFWPEKRNILAVEKYFDIEIKEPWAYYDVVVNDVRFKGYLRLRGTMDLLTLEDNNTLEMTDYKTGSSNDWVTGVDKDYKKLKNDPQFLIYFAAIKRVYPEFKHILMSLFFTKKTHFGPRTVDFYDSDVQRAELLIREHANSVRQNIVPKLLGNGKHFKCKYCPFYSENFKDTGKSYCKFFAEEIRRNGIDKTTEKYIITDGLLDYEGGGKTVKEIKEGE